MAHNSPNMSAAVPVSGENIADIKPYCSASRTAHSKLIVDLPRYGGDISEIESIVPEVYELTITINNLTTDTGDLLIKSGGG